MQQSKTDVKTTIKKLLITVLYDKKVPSDKLVVVKQAIIALMKVTENQMVFTPTSFTETAWQQVLHAQMDHSACVAGGAAHALFLMGPIGEFLPSFERGARGQDAED